MNNKKEWKEKEKLKQGEVATIKVFAHEPSSAPRVKCRLTEDPKEWHEIVANKIYVIDDERGKTVCALCPVHGFEPVLVPPQVQVASGK